MEIYLVQHGEAKPESEDRERPLTDKGRTEVESVAHYVAGLGVRIARIHHSGKLRAKQTAELFARYFAPPHGVIEQKGLGPMDDPGIAEHLLSEAQESLMIVGHLPHLSRMASLLVLSDTEKEVVGFKMGGMVCLSRNDDRWLVSWALTPQVIR